MARNVWTRELAHTISIVILLLTWVLSVPLLWRKEINVTKLPTATCVEVRESEAWQTGFLGTYGEIWIAIEMLPTVVLAILVVAIILSVSGTCPTRSFQELPCSSASNEVDGGKFVLIRSLVL